MMDIDMYINCILNMFYYILNHHFWKSRIIFFTALLISFLFWYKHRFFNYWKKHRIPHETPTLTIFGYNVHVPNILGNIPFSFFLGYKSMDNIFRESYNKFKNHQFHGLYMLGRPMLIINDPDLIRTILVREFKQFPDRGWFVDDIIDPMSNNLFLQPHDKWIKLRRLFSPMFTPGKIRNMSPLVIKVCSRMIEVCNLKLDTSNVLEVKDIMERYAIDIISSVIYGCDTSSLYDEGNEFRKKGLQAFKIGNFKFLFGAFFPEVLKYSRSPLYSKDVRNFFSATLKTAMNNRLQAPIQERDFVDLFIELKNEYNREENATVQDDNAFDMIAAAQALVFFLAGFETTAYTATFCLYELAFNRDVQVSLQSEIDQIAETDGGMNYQNIANSNYLDRVIAETLRKHAVAPFLTRMGSTEYKIPDSDYTIPKGMRLIIPTCGLQNDPEFYPNPDIFDPDRFLRRYDTDISRYNFLPFGEGPRNCIGKKFALLEIKQAVARFVYHYDFWISDKTKIPLKCDDNSFMHIPGEGLYLRIRRRRLP